MRDIINKLETINEDLGDMAREAELDHEVQMARADLYKAAKYSVAIHRMLKDVPEMEGIDGWVAAKITKAADYLGSVKHYMEGEMMADVELAVVPVAGDMTDAMTVPQESVEVIEAEERDYICVHAKKGKYECSGTSSYAAAKKAAEHWGLKSTAGIDAHLADKEKTATESIVEGRNDGPMSECCDAPLDGFENGLGRCSDCGEMAGAWNADEIDNFHKELDDVVHKHLGHSSDEEEEEEMNEEDVIGDIIAKLPKTTATKQGGYSKTDRDMMNKLIAKVDGKTPAKPMAPTSPSAVMSPVTKQKQANAAAKMQTNSKFSEWSKK